MMNGLRLAGLSSETTLAGVFVDAPNTDVIQGTLDLLILKTLSLQPLHGFGIARRIEQISRGAFKVNPGSLLTAFHRLERAGRFRDRPGAGGRAVGAAIVSRRLSARICAISAAYRS